MIASCRIVQRPQFVDRVRELTEAEMVLEFYDHRDLVPLPTARQPPAWIGINKNATSLHEMILDRRKELVAWPSAPRTNCLPTAFADGGPVMNRDCLRT